MLLDPYEWPLSAARIAELCQVSITTARRWIDNDTAPGAARQLIQLTQRGRIMPDTWPAHWRINGAGALDVGFTKLALTPAQLEWYFFSCELWYQLTRLLPEIEEKLADIQKSAKSADIIILDEYRKKLRQFRDREFLLREDIGR